MAYCTNARDKIYKIYIYTTTYTIVKTYILNTLKYVALISDTIFLLFKTHTFHFILGQSQISSESDGVSVSGMVFIDSSSYRRVV